ncbi:MAG TPA: ATP-binding cassette domain-containing protein [Acholeplasma sp.]|nr:ATP-binding cassette domain-containing protein [Acholeplasma sp.]
MIISIKDLTHKYDVDVLNNLSLELSNHKSIALIGVSGSGKSTLIRLLSGLEKPTTGDIRINGLDVTDKVYKDKIGFVFQNHNLFPHLTLKQNITLVLEKTRGYSKADANTQAEKFLKMLRLDDQMYKLPKNVSGGQAQRASIARALATEPEIIFLDEPTASLDPILTFEVLTAIKELKSLGKKFIFVSHVISFVRDFADYVVFMHEGTIAEQGTPDILDNPKSDLLKDFMEKVK